jgi:snapalysin
MLKRTFLGVLAGSALALTLVAAPTAATADPIAQVVTITYDDSQAGEFRTAVANGIAIWNNSVTNVRIVRANGSGANVRVIADNGWPRANLGPIRPGGRGTVWMGRQAVQQGFNPTRIASHEFGHILGLPDRRTGLCSDLMSGSSAPTSCTNANPSSAERAAVQRNYASGLAAQRQNDQAVMIVDAG